MKDFCNETNFQEMVLNKLFPGENWEIDKTVPNSGVKTRPDFRCERLKLIIEFNGYRHYIVSNQILRDYRKHKLYEKMGYKVVEFPYWVQPDKETLKVLFNGFDCDFTQHFSDQHQGFMSTWTSCVLPADFPELGLERFEKELKRFTSDTKKRILWSLKNRIDEKHPIQAIVPKKLQSDIRNIDMNGIGSSIL